MTQRAAESGGATILLGQRSDPERFFAAADLLLHTPRLEAFGLVLVQGMAAGLPVIASSVGGIPEIIVPGVGELAPSEDSAAIGGLIADLFGDAARRTRLATAALERARSEYGSATCAQRHRAMYDAILR